MIRLRARKADIVWSPLYYPYDPRGLIPSSQGDVPPLIAPPVPTNRQLVGLG